MARTHCWADKGEWMESEYGYGSTEHMEASEEGATCLLSEGHDGPHVWTPDSDITVRFAKPEDTP